jgi:GT2 family glycosyltransferase
VSPPTGPIVVAIPVRNEAGHLGACLEALDAQIDAAADHVVLLLNNCTDASAAIARQASGAMRPRLHAIEIELPAERAHAGQARHLAVRRAASLAGPAGVILTTDADARVDPFWLAGNLAAFRRGADAVAGWVELDPVDWHAIPLALHEDDARECAYDALCDALHACLDPDPHDPPPRHTQASGASLAVTASMLRRIGGVPPIPTGEDRALVDALRRADARLRHAPECRVVVSGRTEGRAAGGMADTIRRRLAAPDPFLDDRLEPARACARRAALRHAAAQVRAQRRGSDTLARALGLAAAAVEAALAQETFGAAWDTLATRSPRLARRRVPAAAIARETDAARAELTAAQADPERVRSELLGLSVS